MEQVRLTQVVLNNGSNKIRLLSESLIIHHLQRIEKCEIEL